MELRPGTPKEAGMLPEQIDRVTARSGESGGRVLAREVRWRLEAVGHRDGRRSSYDAAIRLTAAARKKITARASKEMRAVGNYITTLVLGDLRKG